MAAQQTRPAAAPAETNGQQSQAMVQFARRGEQLDLTPFFDNPAVNNLSPVKIVKPMSPNFMVGISAARLSSDPTQGDVYKDGESYRHSKIGLMKLAAGAGIQWYTPECKLVYRTDSAACFQAVGFLIGPDGVPRPIKGTKEIDLRVLEDEARFEQEDKTAKGKVVGWTTTTKGKNKPKFAPWESAAEREAAIDLAIRKATLQKRKNLVALAETGAYLRAIRSALTLKSNWTKEEISKPYVMVRTYLDPEADRELIQETVRASVSMGHAPAVAAPRANAGLIAPPMIDVAAIPEAPEEEGDASDDEPTETYDGGIPDDEPGDGRLPL